MWSLNSFSNSSSDSVCASSKLVRLRLLALLRLVAALASALSPGGGGVEDMVVVAATRVARVSVARPTTTTTTTRVEMTPTSEKRSRPEIPAKISIPCNLQ